MDARGINEDYNNSRHYLQRAEACSSDSSLAPGKFASSGYKWIARLDGGPRRVNHAAAEVRGVIFTFGGFSVGEDYNALQPIDVFALNTHTFKWTVLKARGRSDSVPPSRTNSQSARFSKHVPFQRYGHTVVAYEGKIYLFGGRNDKRACNKVYRFNPVDLTWSLVPTTGYAPGARDGHSACVFGDRMYIFGGFEEEANGFSNDVFALDLRIFDWSYVHTRGTPPSHRDFHSACAIGTRMYVFGGRGDLGGQYYSHRDMYCNRISFLDTETSCWHYPPVTTTDSAENTNFSRQQSVSQQPSGRRSHSSFVYRGEMYIFGGYESIKRRHYGNMFCFNTEENQWREVPINVGRTGPPCPRRRHMSIVVGDRLFVFGGTSPRDGAQEQYLHAHDPQMMNAMDQQQERLVDHDDLYVLDFRPSLKTLCLSAVIELGLNVRQLPESLQSQIRDMTYGHTLTRGSSHVG